MFLRAHCRKKDGKIHRYFSIVESHRTRGRKKAFQKHVLYLGEINDSQKAAWTKTISIFPYGEKAKAAQTTAIFPDDRTLPEGLDCPVVQVNLKHLELRHPRQWGACWLGQTLWEQLCLDEFWAPRLPESREGTSWLNVLKILTLYRLIDPGSEWRLHREWYGHSALGDLLQAPTVMADDTLYRCLDKLLVHKQDLFSFLYKRWENLFGIRYEVLLYDLTSTYFECDVPATATRCHRKPKQAMDTVASTTDSIETDVLDDEASNEPEDGSTDEVLSGKRQFGYSRDKRGDCVQVVIALIVTPEGFPLAYEVLAGNTADNTTLPDFLKKVETQYGKADRVWVMDRGVPTEAVLKTMRESDPPVSYLVGTPKGRLSALEARFLEQPWEKVRDEVTVKLITQDDEVYVLARSNGRIDKERAMRIRRLKRLWKRLKQLQNQKLSRDKLLMKIGAAQKDAGRVQGLVAIVVPSADDATKPQTPDFTFTLDRNKLRIIRKREGSYLLRSNLKQSDPSAMWRYYIQLTEIEQAFKELKHDLSLRPIFHQREDRIDSHIFVSFLAYCLQVTLKQRLRSLAPGLTPRSVLEKFSAIQMVDVHLPTTDGRHLVLSRYTQPEKELQMLIHCLNLILPEQAPPKIQTSQINPPPSANVVQTF
jgi:transposase